MLLIRASTSGVGEEIDIKSLNCCGMRPNTSKCWTNNLECVCEDCGNRTLEDHYRLEFCSSFALKEILNGAFLRNRTSCREQLNILQGVDNAAYRSYKNFEEIIQRTECGENDERTHTYSATSTCLDCLEAYKNWICATMLLEATKSKKRTCVDLCETVLQRCPYLQPVPNDTGNLVQVGYSAFNCLELKESKQGYRNLEDCLHVDPMVRCEQNNNTSIIQPTLTTTRVMSSSNSTTNSTSNGRR
ncbi:hypothetical protein ACROYT_G028183 [Oculina patagonica]